MPLRFNIQLLNIRFFRYLPEDFRNTLVFRLIFTGRFLNADKKYHSNIFEGKFCFPNLEDTCMLSVIFNLNKEPKINLTETGIKELHIFSTAKINRLLHK